MVPLFFNPIKITKCISPIAVNLNMRVWVCMRQPDQQQKIQIICNSQKKKKWKELLCFTYIINICWLNGFCIAFCFWIVVDIYNVLKRSLIFLYYQFIIFGLADRLSDRYIICTVSSVIWQIIIYSKYTMCISHNDFINFLSS